MQHELDVANLDLVAAEPPAALESATHMVTLATKLLLFEYLVPERVGHAVSHKAERIRYGIFLCFNSRGLWEISYDVST
jgi:hypothetical protein